MKKVLIIDDDPVFAKTIGDTLPGDAFEVVTASDGNQGMEAFIREQPDLILLDIQMPNLDGIGFLTKLREEHPEAKTPVLISSNVSGLDTVSEGVQLGIRGYIVKAEETMESISETIQGILK